MRERIGSFMGRRRGDSTGDVDMFCCVLGYISDRASVLFEDQAPMTLPRKLSLSNMQGGLASPRDGALPSPRVRPGFEGILGETWTSRRRGTSESITKVGAPPHKDKETDGENKGPDIKEEEEDTLHASEHRREPSSNSKSENGATSSSEVDPVQGSLSSLSIAGSGDGASGSSGTGGPPPGLTDLASVEWSYLDPQGQIQGGYLLKFTIDRFPHAMSTPRTIQS